MLLEESTKAIRLFCFAYLFRWFGVTTQGFLSAIEKPALATVMSVSTAFVFPVVMLGALWGLGLNGIWLNFVGVNVLTAILAASLLLRVLREIRGKQAKASQAVEDTGMG
jgi:Na+-driven multidrug efflux pump